jgi:hypothetical protein
LTAEIKLNKAIPFAHAVHDALVEALGITEEGD